MSLTIFKDFNQDYNETKKILEYTLFFNLQNKIKASDSEEIIHGIFSETDDACMEFSIPQDIFGSTTKIEAINRCKFDKKVISLLLRNHCIISALNTAKSLSLNKYNTDVSPYRIAKYFGDLGYFELKDLYEFEYKTNQDKERVSIKYNLHTDKDNTNKSVFDFIGCYNDNPNNFLQSANKYKKYISDSNYTKMVLAYSYGNNMDDDSYNEYCSNLHNSDLYYNTIRHSKLLNKRIDNMKPKVNVSYNEIVDFSIVLQDFVKNSRDSSDKAKTNYADMLLYKNNLERFYPYLLLHELVRNHNSKSNNYPLSGDLYYSIISKFNMLPNTFSRRYFINWAYNSIEYTFLKENYWNNMKENNKTIVGLLNDTAFDAADHIHTWMTLVNDFLYYASYITFPIYEKTFFIKLYEFYKDKSPENPLNAMIDSLTDYVNNYYDFLTYDFGDGELMDQHITFKISKMNPSDYGFNGQVGSDAATDAYIKYFMKNYNECNFTNIKDKSSHKMHDNRNKESINPLQEPLNIESYDSAKFYYEISRNIFSISDLDYYFDRTFSKEYFRIPYKKCFDINKFVLENNTKNLPLYNYNFGHNQINEMMKIQKYAETNRTL